MNFNPSSRAGLVASQLELWRGDRCLFKDVGFALAPGHGLHVTGPNGVGKTSLLRVLCGLSWPEEGSVAWNGNDIRRHRGTFARDLCFVGHRDGLKEALDVRENLYFGAALWRRPDTAEIEACVDDLRLRGHEHKPLRVLSAGQRRRVALGRALLCRTPLWVLDEPFANLDVEGRDWWLGHLEKHLDGGGSLVVTSHLALQFEDRIAQLEMRA